MHLTTAPELWHAGSTKKQYMGLPYSTFLTFMVYTSQLSGASDYLSYHCCYTSRCEFTSINNTITLTLRRSNELSIQVHKTFVNQHASLHHHPHLLQWLNVFHMPTCAGLLAIALLLEWTWMNKLGVTESHHTLLLLLSLISGLLWLVYCDVYVMTTCSGEVCQSCLVRSRF